MESRIALICDKLRESLKHLANANEALGKVHPTVPQSALQKLRLTKRSFEDRINFYFNKLKVEIYSNVWEIEYRVDGNYHLARLTNLKDETEIKKIFEIWKTSNPTKYLEIISIKEIAIGWDTTISLYKNNNI